MPELDWITIEGFKSFKKLERLPLRDINIVIGANGSGKSNFLAAFELLRAYGEGRLTAHVQRHGNAERILHQGSKHTERVVLSVGRKENLQARISLISTAADELDTEDSPASPSLKFASGGVVGWSLGEKPGADPDNLDYDIGIPRAFFKKHARDWRVYHLNDTSFSALIKKTSDVNDNQFLRSGGENLASYLFLLQKRHPTEYSLILRTIQLVAPFVDDLILSPLRHADDKILLAWKQKDLDFFFNASSFSDGTLRFIALATLILQPLEYRPSVLLIDEPELGLHPYAVNLLASLIKQESLRTQMIVSTQSPQFLDCFEPEDVVVAERENGATQLRRLDRKSLETWLEDYSLGDLWQKNQFGGQPTTD